MDIPTRCPCCGAHSLNHDTHTAAILAVCDVLAVKALEAMGKWIVRAERSRFRVLGTRPFHEAHTLWQPEEAVVDKALKNAWDVIPPLMETHGCCDITPRQVTDMLDGYVHDLVITGTPHQIGELRYRMQDRLGMPVWHDEECPSYAETSADVAVGS